MLYTTHSCALLSGIQGGGTPMTVQELRRAISPGQFTELLDKLAKDELVLQALDGCTGSNVNNADDKSQLILRFFQLHNTPTGTKFGKPSLIQHGLETMKHLNKDMKYWEGDGVCKRDDLVKPLKKSLDLISKIFNKHEAFRRPVQLQKGDKVIHPKKVWFDQSKLKEPLWDCTVATFAREDILSKKSDLIRNAGPIRENLISLMQTHPLFTDTLRSTEVKARVQLFVSEIKSVIEDSRTETNKRVNIPYQERRELIKAARADKECCPWCDQPMQNCADEHLHIDHIIPVSKGGTNTRDNLQVMHKTCNLMKSNQV